MPLASFFGPPQDVAAAAGVAGPDPGGANAGAAKRLPFTMEPQGPSRWCWAATTASVATFYAQYHQSGTAVTQCQVATMCLDAGNCCPPPVDPNDARNTEYGLDAALVKVGHRNGPFSAGTLDFGAVKTEIDGDRPICCHIKWNGSDAGNDGHFVAIVGYDAGTQEVDVCDPLNGDSTIAYQTLIGNYLNAGSWDGTCLTS
jgi:hypothetical protein